MGAVITNLFQGLEGIQPSEFTSCHLLVVVQNVIQLLFQLSIVLAVAYSMYGGFLVMTAGGSEEKVSAGKGAITAAVIGLTISLTAWLLIDSLMNALGGGPIAPWNRLSCS